MTDYERGAFTRPALPDPPFLCAECRYGRVIGQKLQPWLLPREAWQEDWPEWHWQASCRSPRITPWKFTVFVHPVVACDGFRSRKILTTEDVARKKAKRAEKRLRKRKKKEKRRRKRSKR